MSWDGSTARLYINGVQDPTTLAASGSIPDDSGNTKAIGSRGGIDQFFSGLIDEVEIFTRALSIEEIQNIYAAGSYGMFATPIAYLINEEGIIHQRRRGRLRLDSQAPGSSPPERNSGPRSGMRNFCELSAKLRICH